ARARPPVQLAPQRPGPGPEPPAAVAAPRGPELRARAIEPDLALGAERVGPAAAHALAADVIGQRNLEPVALGAHLERGADLPGQRGADPLVRRDLQDPVAAGRLQACLAPLAFQRKDAGHD